MKKRIFGSCVFVFSVCFISAQDDNSFLSRIIREDSAAVEALAMYPEEVRENIYKACMYPEALVHMSNRQKDIKEQFKALLSPYAKDEQQKIWNLTTYPGLIEKLASTDVNDKGKREKIVQEYPEEIRETAIYYGEKEHSLLLSINTLYGNAEKSFEALTRNYPADAKKAFKELLNLPEVISLLTENMKIAVETGDIYKRNPLVLRRQMDSLNLLLATENAKNLEDWKKGLNENPEAMKELQESGKEYAKEQGYKEEEIKTTETIVVTNYVYHSYPWWFGYPWWYDYPYWYQRPYWYDWGYYTGMGGVIVFVGLPTPYFMHWHFHHPHHHYHYPHLSDYYLGYYYGRRRAVSGFNAPVKQWIRENEPNLPKHYLAGDKGRPARLKELGTFEMELGKQQKNNPVITREKYLKENKEQYPLLTTPGGGEVKPRDTKSTQTPVYQPKPAYPQKHKEPVPVTPQPRPEKPKPSPVKPAPAVKPSSPVRPSGTPKARPAENKNKPAVKTVPSPNTP